MHWSWLRFEANIIRGSGAKGKFSGGFDISAFKGSRGGNGMFTVSMSYILVVLPYFLKWSSNYVFTEEGEQRPGYVSIEILSDVVEGTYLDFYLSIHNLELLFKDSTW